MIKIGISSLLLVQVRVEPEDSVQQILTLLAILGLFQLSQLRVQEL
jgi:hypothetical protein